MRPQTISQTGVGFSNPARVDYRQANFQVGVGVNVTGTVSYTLQHTFDDIADFADIADYNTNATWFDNSDTALVAASDKQDTNYAFPIQSSRIEVLSGSGTATATYLQGNSQ